MTDARTTEPGSLRAWVEDRIAEKHRIVNTFHHSSYEFAYTRGEVMGLRMILEEITRRAGEPTTFVSGNPLTTDEFSEMLNEYETAISAGICESGSEEQAENESDLRHYLNHYYALALSRAAEPTITSLSGTPLTPEQFAEMLEAYTEAVEQVVIANGADETENACELRHWLNHYYALALAAVASDLGTRAQTDAGGEG